MNWEEELREKWVTGELMHVSDIEDFIQSLLDQRDQEMKKRCLIEGCRYGIPYVDKKPKKHCMYCGEENKLEGVFWKTEAISTIKEKQVLREE